MKHTTRDSTPTSLCENNSEKIGKNISTRSARRRCKETLIACKNVHGHVEGNQTYKSYNHRVVECQVAPKFSQH